MGNELGHFREWDEKRELDWDLLKYPFHDAFQKYFGALSRLYATQPALYAGEYDPRCFEWVPARAGTRRVRWLRKGAGQTILCVMNTQNTAHKKFPLYLTFPAGAEELLNTEAPCWGGADKSKPKALHTSDGGVYGRDYTLTRGPARHGQPDVQAHPRSAPPRGCTGQRPPGRCRTPQGSPHPERQGGCRRIQLQKVIFVSEYPVC